MKGAFFLGAQSFPVFEIHDMSFGALGSHDVLVEVHSCGICGTDVHIYHGEEGSAIVTPPVVLGHEFSGVVTKIGDSVSAVSIGDHVTIDPNMFCGKCRPCRMGRKQNCENLKALGVNCNGGFAQYAVCPEEQCFVVDKGLDFDAAAMAEPLACVVHGIDNAHILPGQTVIVIGGGTIGLLMVQMARISGASKVILSEPVEARRNVGLEVGADAVIDPINESISDRIREITGRDGTNIVIECVGKPFATEQAFQAAGFGATILLFSVLQVGATVALPLFDVYKP